MILSLALVILASAGLSALSPLHAQGRDRTSLKRKLENNRAFMIFIDTCLTNAAPGAGQEGEREPSWRELFAQVIGSDRNANLWFLKGEEGLTLRELQESRYAMQELYGRVTEQYLISSEKLLEAATPLILEARDMEGRHFLNKGYRYYYQARKSYMRGHNIRKNMPGNQIRYFQESIHKNRIARRFAILAMIYSRLPHEEKPNRRLVSKKEYDAVLERERIKEFYQKKDLESETAFEKTLFLLGTMISRDVLGQEIRIKGEGDSEVTLNLMDIHQDNYGRFIPGRESVWQRLMGELNKSRIQGLDASTNGGGGSPSGAPASGTAPAGTPGNGANPAGTN